MLNKLLVWVTSYQPYEFMQKLRRLAPCGIVIMEPTKGGPTCLRMLLLIAPPQSTETNASSIVEILLEKIQKEIGNSGTLPKLRQREDYQTLCNFGIISIKVLLGRLQKEPDNHTILLALGDLLRGKLDPPPNVIEDRGGGLSQRYIEYGIRCGHISE